MSKPKILVVDDSFDNIALIQGIFDGQDWAVDYFYSGIMALEKIKQQKYDLILLDIRMPDINGLDVCRILKQSDELKTTPVLFMTAFSDNRTLAQAFEAGAVDYIKKPYMEEELMARVNAHLAVKLAQNELVIEIAKRTKAEEQLKIRLDKHKLLSEHYNKLSENFRTIFNSSSEMMIITDLNGSILEVNRTTVQNLEYTYNELLTFAINDIEVAERKAKVRGRIEAIVAQHKCNFSSEVESKTGKVFLTEVDARVFSYFEKKAILWVIHDVTEKRRLKNELLNAIVETENRERKLFALKLHDDLAPVLTTVQLFAGLIAKNTNDEKLLDVGRNILDATRQSIEITKNIANSIYPHLLENIGLQAALDAYCEQVNKTNKVHIVLDYCADKTDLPRNIESVIYYVLKELINNTILHAKVQNIAIGCRATPKWLEIDYTDDGHGILSQNVADATGMGLKNIRHRIETVNGRFDLNSADRQGFAAKILIPV